MKKEILTVAKIKTDGIEWEESPFTTTIAPFPALKTAKLGDKFKLTYKKDGSIAKVESV